MCELLKTLIAQNVTVCGQRAFTEAIKLNEVSRVGPNPIWLVSLYEEETWAHRDTRGVDAKKKDQVRTQPEGGHLQTKERDLKEVKPADILFLDSGLQE